MDRKRNARRRQLSGAHTAESWNAAHPVGTSVRYWPVYPPLEGIPPVDTVTRSEAWALGDGSVVVKIVGKTGGVYLSHVELRPGEKAVSEKHPLDTCVDAIRGWAYTDSLVELDRARLREALAADHAKCGYLMSEEQCAAFVCGDDESGAPPSELVRDFPRTHAYLNEEMT